MNQRSRCNRTWFNKKRCVKKKCHYSLSRIKIQEYFSQILLNNWFKCFNKNPSLYVTTPKVLIFNLQDVKNLHWMFFYIQTPLSFVLKLFAILIQRIVSSIKDEVEPCVSYSNDASDTCDREPNLYISYFYSMFGFA